MKILNAAAIAGNDLSLNVFVSDEFMERDKCLLKSLGYDPELAHKFNRGETAVKMDLFKNGRENAYLIRATIPKLVELSRVAILIDHQSILQLTNEPVRDSLGVALVLSASDGKRYCYLIGFEAVPNTSTPVTVQTTKSILKEKLEQIKHTKTFALLRLSRLSIFKFVKDFNLLQSAESGRIPCISDSKCYPAAEKIAGNGFASRCDWHNQMNMQERSGNTNLKVFDDESEKKWKV